ncbi:TPA: transcriptional regulator [Escherichia coli]|uniref:transcriptional regulator n=1 Tax=Escherichia coli TaxID=562 RepID=UPI000DD9B38F|nr:transcriptional regulator [Escherichia coli]QMN06549.1 transcriptional regulator [Escherichia coli]HCQ0458872.1 transcriptional regulator [Escherichia coli]HCQ0520521.1 transcriptional regulator [Escherichia coli]HCS4678129.1 transcriptional regulator [Escherichia coli]HCS4894480.1 transcriptional regulator [Escherichia coli]
MFSLSVPFLYVLRSYSSWHYPNSPKNGKPALSPRHDWLNTGSLLQNIPLRIWFYPQ